MDRATSSSRRYIQHSCFQDTWVMWMSGAHLSTITSTPIYKQCCLRTFKNLSHYEMRSGGIDFVLAEAGAFFWMSPYSYYNGPVILAAREQRKWAGGVSTHLDHIGSPLAKITTLAIYHSEYNIYSSVKRICNLLRLLHQGKWVIN